jgi:hypothetical protein
VAGIHLEEFSQFLRFSEAFAKGWHNAHHDARQSSQGLGAAKTRKAAPMTPLDLSKQPPRPPRTTMLDFYFLPRTVDKLRAELPGGDIGPYLNHDTGFSAFVVKRLGLDMDEFREAVARADDEAAVIAWLSERIDTAAAPALNAKLETFVVERMSPSDQILVRERHPVMASRPELSKMLDILDADDEHAFSSPPRPA